MDLELLLRAKNWGRHQCTLCEDDLRLVYDPDMEYTFNTPKFRVRCECGYEDKRYGQLNNSTIQVVIRG